MPLDFPSHRREKRGPTDRQAEIKLSLFKSIPCSIENLSASGARLVLSKQHSMPKKFELCLSGTGARRRHKCKTCWQEGNMVGVEFLSAKLG